MVRLQNASKFVKGVLRAPIILKWTNQIIAKIVLFGLPLFSTGRIQITACTPGLRFTKIKIILS
jgi:hypothetical protein